MPEALPIDDSPAPEPILPDGEICTACVQINPPRRDYCAHCGAPLNSLLGFNPFDQTLFEGFAFRRAVDGPASPVILIGIWLTFGSGLFCFALVIGNADLRLGRSALASYFTLPFIAIPILYRTTANYLRKRAAHDPFPPDEPSSPPDPPRS